MNYEVTIKFNTSETSERTISSAGRMHLALAAMGFMGTYTEGWVRPESYLPPWFP